MRTYKIDVSPEAVELVFSDGNIMYLQGHHPGFGAEYQSARRVRLGETLKPHKPGAETIDSRDWFAQEEVSA